MSRGYAAVSNLLAVALVIAVTGCASGGDYVYSKPRVTLDQYRADRDACRAEARQAETKVRAGVWPDDLARAARQAGPTYQEQLGHVLAQTSNQTMATCFAERGYVQVPLSAAEQRQRLALADAVTLELWIEDLVVRSSQDRPDPR